MAQPQFSIPATMAVDITLTAGESVDLTQYLRKAEQFGGFALYGASGRFIELTPWDETDDNETITEGPFDTVMFWNFWSPRMIHHIADVGGDEQNPTKITLAIRNQL